MGITVASTKLVLRKLYEMMSWKFLGTMPYGKPSRNVSCIHNAPRGIKIEQEEWAKKTDQAGETGPSLKKPINHFLSYCVKNGP